MRISYRYLLCASCLIIATVLFQKFGGYSTGLLSNQLASLGIRAYGCSQAARLFGGKRRAVSSIALSGASATTQAFPKFEKFVHSVSLPQAMDPVRLTETVSPDINSASFTEALFSIEYSPSGSCPASGTRFPDYESTFAAMPDNKFLAFIFVRQ